MEKEIKIILKMKKEQFDGKGNMTNLDDGTGNRINIDDGKNINIDNNGGKGENFIKNKVCRDLFIRYVFKKGKHTPLVYRITEFPDDNKELEELDDNNFLYCELEAKWIENVDGVIPLHPKCTAYINSHFKNNTCQFTGLGEYYNRDSNSPDKFKSEFKEFPFYVKKYLLIMVLYLDLLLLLI